MVSCVPTSSAPPQRAPLLLSKWHTDILDERCRCDTHATTQERIRITLHLRDILCRWFEDLLQRTNITFALKICTDNKDNYFISNLIQFESSGSYRTAQINAVKFCGLQPALSALSIDTRSYTERISCRR